MHSPIAGYTFLLVTLLLALTRLLPLPRYPIYGHLVHEQAVQRIRVVNPRLLVRYVDLVNPRYPSSWTRFCVSESAASPIARTPKPISIAASR